jgi:hypothetical protein
MFKVLPLSIAKKLISSALHLVLFIPLDGGTNQKACQSLADVRDG